MRWFAHRLRGRRSGRAEGPTNPWRLRQAICAPIALGVLLSLTACAGHAGRRPPTPEPTDESAQTEGAEAEAPDAEVVPSETDTTVSTEQAEATAPSKDASEPESSIRLATPIEPRAGATVEGEIQPGETVVHPIHLEADEYLEAYVDLSPDAVDLRLHAAPSDETRGSALRSAIGSGEFSATPPGQTLWAVSPRRGNYRFELKLLANRGEHRYQVRLLSLYPAGGRERSLVAGQEAYDAALRAHREHRYEDALEKFEAAWRKWSSANYLRGIAAPLGKMGQCLLALGKRDEAAEHFRRAIAAWREAGDLASVAGVLIRLAHLEVHRNRWKAAEEFLTQATEIANEVDARWAQGNALDVACYIHTERGENQLARQVCTEAVKHWKGMSESEEALDALINLGSISKETGKLEEARSYYQQVLHVLEEHPDSRREATVRNNLGVLYDSLGDLHEALVEYQRALELYEQTGQTSSAARMLYNLGTARSRTGALDETLEYYNRARELQTEIGATRELITTLLGIGWVHVQRGSAQLARKTLEEALELSRLAEVKPLIALSLERIGELRLTENRPDSALALFQEALELEEEIGNRWQVSGLWSDLARTHLRLNEPKQALDALYQAATINEEIGNRRGLAANYYQRARIHRKHGDLEAARRSIEQAIDVAKILRQRINDRSLRARVSATHQKYHDFFIELLINQHERDPQAGRAAEALWAAERAKARSLLEVLSEADLEFDKRVPPDLAEKRERIRQEIAGLQQRREYLLEAGDGDRVPDEKLFGVDLDLRRLLVELTEVERKMRDASPAYAALTRPQTVTVGEIQRTVLDSQTALLEFRLGEGRSFLFAVTAQGFETFELPNRESLEEDARCMHWLITAFGNPDENVTTSRESCLGFTAELYQSPPVDSSFKARVWRRRQIERAFQERALNLAQDLLGEAERQGFLDGRRIAVIPDGALEYIPFASLPHPRTGRPLIHSLEVAHLPSASFLHFHRRHSANEEKGKRGTLAIIADPVYAPDDERIADADGLRGAPEDRDVGGRRYSRLEFASEEARAIAAFAPHEKTFLALGPEASRETVLGPALADRQYIHFATHGVIDTRYPQLSRLVLSLVDGTGRLHGDGSLRLHDIYEMDLDAEMVVLSACDTALGREIRGEGLVGLARGFMYAGAERVVASLWPVLDKVTADLMEDFYRGLLQEGRSPAAALRHAQLAMISRSDGAFSFPYYWAGFVFQGDWR